MNRNELIGDIASELARVLDDEEKDLDGDDIDSARTCVEKVLNDAEEVIDEDEGDDEGTETKS